MTQAPNHEKPNAAPLRALNVYAGNLYGGIETLLVTLARQQAVAAGLRWGFALCFEGRLSEELRGADANVMSLGPVRLSRPWTVQRARRRLAEILRSGEWDVVVTHGFWPHIVAAPTVRREKTPLVFWAHGPQNAKGWLEWWSKRLPPDLVVSNSRATQVEVRRDVFKTVPNEVFYCPIAPPRFQPTPEMRQRVRAEFETPSDAVVILTSCRLDPWKGHQYLLETLATMKDLPGWIWWITNKPQTAEQEVYLANIKTRVAELGIGERVRFLGQVPDVREVLASADVHCQPNVGAEPFGSAFVEALYAGLPVVTTNFGGAAEIVDETCGILLPEKRGDLLASTLTKLVVDVDLRRRLSGSGPARAAFLCDPAARLAELTAMLRKVCQDSTRKLAGVA